MAYGDQWSNRKYPNGCRSCGQTRSKHVGLGLCQNCYRNAEIKEAAKNGTLEDIYPVGDSFTKEEGRAEVMGDNASIRAEVDDDGERLSDPEEVVSTSPGERRPGSSTNAPAGDPVSDSSPGPKLSGFFKKKKAPTGPAFTAPTREKQPRVAGRRQTTAGTIEDIWSGVGGLAQRSGFVPLGRYMAWQAPAAGELLDQAVAGTVIDRKFLQPAVKARGRLDVVGAIMGPPALIIAIQRNPERAEMLLPALRSAIRGSLPTLLPAMKKAQAREEKINQAIRDYLPEGMDLPEGVDPVDMVIAQMFDGWVPQYESNIGDAPTPEDINTSVSFS